MWKTLLAVYAWYTWVIAGAVRRDQDGSAATAAGLLRLCVLGPILESDLARAWYWYRTAAPFAVYRVRSGVPGWWGWRVRYWHPFRDREGCETCGSRIGFGHTDRPLQLPRVLLRRHLKNLGSVRRWTAWGHGVPVGRLLVVGPSYRQGKDWVVSVMLGNGPNAGNYMSANLSDLVRWTEREESEDAN